MFADRNWILYASVALSEEDTQMVEWTLLGAGRACLPALPSGDPANSEGPQCWGEDHVTCLSLKGQAMEKKQGGQCGGPLGKAPGLGGKRTGRGVGERKQQDFVVGMQVLLHRLHVPARRTPRIPGEPCAGDGPLPSAWQGAQGRGGTNALVFLPRLGSERLHVLM